MKNASEGFVVVFPLKWALVLTVMFVFVFGDVAEYVGTQFFVLVMSFNNDNLVRILGGMLFLPFIYIWGDNFVAILKWVFNKVVQGESQDKTTAKYPNSK